MKDSNSDAMRLDQWLFVARFFKSRPLAQQAVSGGKVHWQQQRVKPGHRVRINDSLTITKGPYQFTVVIKQLAPKRGPASIAQTLYEETPASLKKRDMMKLSLQANNAILQAPNTKPNKKQRRQLRDIRGKE